MKSGSAKGEARAALTAGPRVATLSDREAMSRSVVKKGAPVAPELTPWFDGKTKPARPGVYQTALFPEEKESPEPRYSRWTGREWMDSMSSPQGAMRTNLRGCQRKEWRGLAKKPEAT